MGQGDVAVMQGRRMRSVLTGMPSVVTVGIGCALVGAIGWADVATGVELALSIFYYVPIAFVTWFAGRRSGVVTAVVAAIVWYGADVLAGATYSQAWIPYWNASVRLGMYLLLAVLLGRLRAAFERESELARTDSLTGVSNARHFHETARLELARATRGGGAMTLAYVDVDDFKTVNDDYGHSAGDELLRTIGRALVRNVRALDTVARVGGDEFVVLLPDADGDGGGRALARIVRGVECDVARLPQSVTFSVGAVTFASPPATVDEMMWAADHVMYSAKRSGKDRIHHRTIGTRRPDGVRVAAHAV